MTNLVFELVMMLFIILAAGNVPLDGVVKQKCILRHQPNLVPQRGNG